MRRTIAIAAVLSLLSAPHASADVVPPEPTGCPTGSVGRTCHGGPYCGVQTCSSSSPCSGGMTCQSVQLCLVKFDCDGRGGPYYVDSVKGTCAGGMACSAGNCTTVQACAAPRPDGKSAQGDAGAVTPSRGCKCELGSRDAASDAPMFLLVVGSAIVHRCRRRRA